jgi:hypothetical protein
MTTNHDPVETRPVATPASHASSEGALVARIKRFLDLAGRWSAKLTGIYPWSYSFPAGGAPDPALQRRVDGRLSAWWISLLASYPILYFRIPILSELVLLAVILRIANIAFWNLRVALVETHVDPAGTPIHEVDSPERSLLLTVGNYIELMVAFAGLYAFFPDCIRSDNGLQPDFLTFLYFSTVTQLTIGYGDVTPLGWIRLAVIVQGFASLGLLAITVARFVALLRVEERRK